MKSKSVLQAERLAEIKANKIAAEKKKVVCYEASVGRKLSIFRVSMDVLDGHQEAEEEFDLLLSAIGEAKRLGASDLQMQELWGYYLKAQSKLASI